MIEAVANAPELISKELKVSRCGDRRKIRLSTNFLPVMGFDAGVRHDVQPMGVLEGLMLKFNAAGSQQVYSRRYASRRNNPFEAVVEIQSQSVLDAAIPSYTERVHFAIRRGEIVIRPLPNHTFSIRKGLKDLSDPFTALVAMTGGVDVRCLSDVGFTIDSILEYRPPEARDTRDLSETGALNVLANCKPRALFNQDISNIDWGFVKEVMRSGPQIALAHISLQCDDFSNVKSQSLKDKSIAELSTTRDLVYDALRMVETVRPACVVLENVPGFGTSMEGQLMRIKLGKWGYKVSEAVLNADEFGGRTGRKRYYMVASVFPDFAMPEPSGTRMGPLWAEIEPFLKDCRDVTHTKSLQEGLSGGRARLITQKSIISPTVLKSQSRQAKDSVYIEAGDGRYLLPSLQLLQYLNGIPSDFNLNCVSGDIASEIIGQSIDVPMHQAVVRAVHEHIGLNVGRHTAVTVCNSKPKVPKVEGFTPLETGKMSASVATNQFEFNF
jgi:DNA (cytosine-5)-methyltransferase 1